MYKRLKSQSYDSILKFDPSSNKSSGYRVSKKIDKTDSKGLTPHRRTSKIARPTTDGQQKKILQQQSTLVVARRSTNDFFLRPPRSTYKTLFFGTRLGEVLRNMSFAKSVPEGLKLSECERGVGGKNSPIRYIPEKDPVQEALEKSKKVNYFKLTLPNTGSELKTAVWASGTPEQFVLHVRSAIHACKQMEHDVNISKAQEAVAQATLELEFRKEEYVQVRSTEKKKSKGNSGEGVPAASESLVAAKSAHEQAKQALEAAKLAAAAEGAKPFELYGNLLSDEARQPWDKIVQAQTTKCPWEDIFGVTQDETPTKNWDSFTECVTFHLQQVFRNDAGEALKYYITNTLRKPNRVPIRQFLVRVEQLNSYLETLPCLYYSPSANQATKKVLPLDDADLATHLLRMCPAKWQTQYDLTEKTTPVNTRALLLILEKIENNAEVETKPPGTIKTKGAEGKRKMESIDSRIPKKPKVSFSDKHCALCKKHGGPYKSHVTRDCRKYNSDGIPNKRNGGAGTTHKNGPSDRNRSKQREREGANFAQIIRKEVKKAFRKQSNKRKKRRAQDSESDSDSDYSS